MELIRRPTRRELIKYGIGARAFSRMMSAQSVVRIPGPGAPQSGGGGPAAPTYVQSANVDNTFANTCVVSLNGTVAGNTIIVVIGYNAATGTITSVSDGTTYTQAAGAFLQSNGETVAVYYRLAGAGGNITVTVTTSANHSTNAAVHEVTPCSALDVAGAAFSNAGSTATDGDKAPSVTTTVANDFVLSFIHETVTTSTVAAGTGYTLRETGLVGGGFHNATETGSKATAGAFQTSWTLSTTTNYIAGVVCFKP